MSDVPGAIPPKPETTTTNGNTSNKSPAYNFAKISIVVIALFVLLVGTLGSMHWWIFSSFVMSDFISFIEAYNAIFITLTSSIGLGGAVKNVLKVIPEKKSDGRDIATGGN